MVGSQGYENYQGYYYDSENRVYYLIKGNEIIRYCLCYNEAGYCPDYSLYVERTNFDLIKDTIVFDYPIQINGKLISLEQKWVYSKANECFTDESVPVGRFFKVSRKRFNKEIDYLKLRTTRL
jgi:hypothetical protein